MVPSLCKYLQHPWGKVPENGKRLSSRIIKDGHPSGLRVLFCLPLRLMTQGMAPGPMHANRDGLHSGRS